ncbi:class I SAM-dependent rRNA methyltransferase [Rhodopirellula sp. ICT_H3.1]|uniref:Class I SAM-dependent rRNA methyltransferase n=1 Tax=Aporhodopirellula aestuarii TaxID=2950107 RepID=A0ABT0U958_9BACT|nr:class I SAM-dependent rRNA methyltransferase [Aporhodopirellula aestuarii]
MSRHPWVLATALAETKKPASDKSAETAPSNDEPAAGAPEANRISQQVDLLDHDGNWIARGLANPASRLRLRLYSFSRDQPIDDAFFAQRIDEAVARRRLARSTDHTGVQESGSKLAEMGERLIFSESDRLSGLIVDRYADCLSVQFTAAALLPRGKFLIDQVLNACEKHGTPCRRVIARMDPATAKHEGVAADQVAEVESWSRGISPAANGSDAATDDSSPMVWYRHNDLKMGIDLRDGQKTGGYLDQQANHAEAARYMAGKRVLDICTYTGGFALAAAKAGASEVIGVDSSEKALEMARQNAEANSLSQVRFEKADCFDHLKNCAGRGETFDAVVLDPPRFAGSRRQVDAALRAYARLNMSAVDLLPPGGILVTCSCSGHVSRADFLNMLVDVGRKRQRDIVILQSRGPSPDHPCAVSCPESDYLKCVIAQVH